MSEDGVKYILDEDAMYTLKKFQAFVLESCDVSVNISKIEYYIKQFHFSFNGIQKIAEAVTTPASAQKRREHSTWLLRVYTSDRTVIFLEKVGF